VSTPHYVRFARAVALAGLAGGCGTAMPVEPQDASVLSDVYVDCTDCTCIDTVDDTGRHDSGLPMCPGIRIILCGCASVGPLPPPDLAVGV
jgi:hypothetical protein